MSEKKWTKENNELSRYDISGNSDRATDEEKEKIADEFEEYFEEGLDDLWTTSPDVSAVFQGNQSIEVCDNKKELSDSKEMDNLKKQNIFADDPRYNVHAALEDIDLGEKLKNGWLEEVDELKKQIVTDSSSTSGFNVYRSNAPQRQTLDDEKEVLNVIRTTNNNLNKGTKMEEKANLKDYHCDTFKNGKGKTDYNVGCMMNVCNSYNEFVEEVLKVKGKELQIVGYDNYCVEYVENEKLSRIEIEDEKFIEYAPKYVLKAHNELDGGCRKKGRFDLLNNIFDKYGFSIKTETEMKIDNFQEELGTEDKSEVTDEIFDDGPPETIQEQDESGLVDYANIEKLDEDESGFGEVESEAGTDFLDESILEKEFDVGKILDELDKRDLKLVSKNSVGELIKVYDENIVNYLEKYNLKVVAAHVSTVKEIEHNKYLKGSVEDYVVRDKNDWSTEIQVNSYKEFVDVILENKEFRFKPVCSSDEYKVEVFIGFKTKTISIKKEKLYSDIDYINRYIDLVDDKNTKLKMNTVVEKILIELKIIKENKMPESDFQRDDMEKIVEDITDGEGLIEELDKTILDNEDAEFYGDEKGLLDNEDHMFDNKEELSEELINLFEDDAANAERFVNDKLIDGDKIQREVVVNTLDEYLTKELNNDIVIGKENNLRNFLKTSLKFTHKEVVAGIEIPENVYSEFEEKMATFIGKKVMFDGGYIEVVANSIIKYTTDVFVQVNFSNSSFAFPEQEEEMFEEQPFGMSFKTIYEKTIRLQEELTAAKWIVFNSLKQRITTVGMLDLTGLLDGELEEFNRMAIELNGFGNPAFNFFVNEKSKQFVFERKYSFENIRKYTKCFPLFNLKTDANLRTMNVFDWFLDVLESLTANKIEQKYYLIS